jgi:hypothetical protein
VGTVYNLGGWGWECGWTIAARSPPDRSFSSSSAFFRLGDFPSNAQKRRRLRLSFAPVPLDEGMALLHVMALLMQRHGKRHEGFRIYPSQHG